MMPWILLVSGLALWSGAHLWKRVAPASRAGWGERGKGLVALLSLLAIVLMVIGYRGAEGPVWWGRSAALVGINNLAMLFAVYLFAASGMKTRLTRTIRNPQLTAVKVFALAHLLVNGDLASLVLFGGLLAWAVAEVVVLKRAGVPWTPPPPAGTGKEIGAALGAVVVTLLIMVVHHWLGVTPWG